MSKRILIVEDHYLMGRALSFLFRREGFEAEVTSDGVEALQLMLADPPAMVILDLDLPRMNGFEICQSLKDKEHTKEVRVFALTASPQREDRIRMMALGADEFMTKPFDPVELVERVKNLLREDP